MYNILFVCMGNICRSPAAEGFFCHHLERSTLAGTVSADSAGTHSYHIGNSPDPRAVDAAARFGVDISGLRARRVTTADFLHFDRIIAMDQGNLEDLRRLAPPAPKSRLELMLAHAPGAGVGEIPDPYYGSRQDFAHMCDLLDQATRGLVRALESVAGEPD